MARQAQPWPDEARPHYIKLFSLNERLRAHLKVAQELATTKRLISYRKQLIEPDGVLRNVYPLLERMQDEADEIADFYQPGERGGGIPKWFRLTKEISSKIKEISQTMSLIELDLINLLDVAVIKKTKEALLAAKEIREKQLSLPLVKAEIGLDEHGLEIITDLLPPQSYALDLEKWQVRPITIKR